MSSKPDMAAMLQSFLAAQNSGTVVKVPATEPTTTPEPVAAAVAEPEPESPVEPTPELAPINAELANVDVAALLAALVQGAGQAQPKAKAKGNGNGGKWESCDVELPSGEKLHLRVAPKGYGCVGFEGRSDYSCIFGYRQRHEALANLFGDGYRTHVLNRLIAMGLKDLPTE